MQFLLTIFCLFLNILLISSAKECKRNLPKFCSTCCALLYDNDDCDASNVFRVKWGADGFLGVMWERQTRVVEVWPGCLLTIWEWRNQTGTNRALGLDGINVYDLDRYAFSRRASSLTCKCTRAAGADPDPTTTVSPVLEKAESMDGSDSGYGSDVEEDKEVDKEHGMEHISEVIPLDEEKHQEIEEAKPKEDTSSESHPSTVPFDTISPSIETTTVSETVDETPPPSEFTIPSLTEPITELKESPQMVQIPIALENIINTITPNGTVVKR